MKKRRIKRGKVEKERRNDKEEKAKNWRMVQK